MKEEVQINRLEWAKVKEFFKQRFGQYPTVTSALFTIGLQEIGLPLTELSKEEKQEVIHVGVCAIMEKQGFYERTGTDEDGWPHFKPTQKVQAIDIDNQENLIKKYIINYFNEFI